MNNGTRSDAWVTLLEMAPNLGIYRKMGSSIRIITAERMFSARFSEDSMIVTFKDEDGEFSNVALVNIMSNLAEKISALGFAVNQISVVAEEDLYGPYQCVQGYFGFEEISKNELRKPCAPLNMTASSGGKSYADR
jgi:hypothetical protein